MGTAAKLIDNAGHLDPREAAERLVAAKRDNAGWLDIFSEHLDRRRSGQSLSRTLAVWDLNQSAAARLFGVSRQALSKWLEQGIPSDRVNTVADLAAATDMLLHHIKRDRIAAVVRRSALALGNQSLLELLEQGDASAVLQACRDMFSFDQAHS